MSEEEIQTVDETTEVEETTEIPSVEESVATQEIDYKKKFSESSREALRLVEENKAKDSELERLRQLTEEKDNGNYTDDSEPLYPGYEFLSEDEQKNLLEYTNSIKKGAIDAIYKDPSIAFARETYNERQWTNAFEAVVTEYPQILESKEDFKKKYFNAKNVPENIGDILKDLSKIYLFDKARDIGARDAEEKAGRYEIERAGAGDKTPTQSRTLEDWNRIASENPAQFAKMSVEYNKDLESGKL